MRLLNILIKSTLLATTIALPSNFNDLPEWVSLAGLSNEHVALVTRNMVHRGASAPPAQIKDTSAKLINDRFHPFIAPGPNDIRGPCPGLNTLANHGVSDSVA